VRRNGSALTEQDLVAHLERRLGAFQIPRHFRIQGDLLPRIASGKVDKRRVRGEFVQRRVPAQS
jgi:acyl-CoA synthetase (AMP-forming)/AMP-acid ligase II